jgi:hypothetical protein
MKQQSKQQSKQPNRMKITSTVVLILSILINLTAQSISEQPRVISYELVKTYTIAQLEQQWKEAGIPKAIAPIKYSVDIYEVIYNTCWHDSSCVKASGLYFVPKGAKKAPLMVYHHGTQIEKARAVDLGGEIAICMGFATDGYAVAYSDYLGLGKGDKSHLYHHVPTEASASMDLVRAVRIINTEKEITLSKQLFVAGYSQGGHATMAFQKVVEADAALHKEFPITASAPMSGAYDLTGVQEDVMFQPYSHPGYLPYLLFSYQEVYNLYPDISVAFKAPYDSLLPPMFNGEYSMDQVNRVMPSIPKDAMRPEVIKAYQDDENFPFKVALQENSTIDWVPKAPMMLCYCEGDEQVNYMNSVVAYESMKKLGTKHLRLKRVAKGMGHNTCALYAVLYTKMYFDSFIKGSKYGRKGPFFKRMLIGIGKSKTKKDIRKGKLGK